MKTKKLKIKQAEKMLYMAKEYFAEDVYTKKTGEYHLLTAVEYILSIIKDSENEKSN